MSAPQEPRDILAIALHDREHADRRCEPTVMGAYYEQADQLLSALKAAGYGFWRKFTDEEEEANFW